MNCLTLSASLNMSLLNTVAVPLDDEISPVSILIVVLLPAPF